MLDYILITIISYFGLLVGSLLIFLASEEQKPGKKYFVFIQNLVLTLIIISLLFFYNLNIFFIIISVIVYLLLIHTKNTKKSYVLYPLIGIFFYVVWADKKFLVILGILTFIYGLLTAFLLVNVKDKKSILKIILSHATFLVTALLPLLISYF